MRALLSFTLIGLSLVVTAVPAYAGDPTAAARPAFRVTTNRNGLPQSSVTALAFDHDGYLWAGTQDGAAMYDGRKWTVVDMPDRVHSNVVRTIYAHPDGSLWFGTREAGAARLANGQWSTVNKANTKSLPSDNVSAILATDSPELGQALWVGTEQGLARRQDDNWETFTSADGLPDDRVECLFETKDEAGRAVLWAGTYKGLARYSAGKWSAAGANAPSAQINCIAEGPNAQGVETIWAGTADGLARLDGDHWTMLRTADGLPDNDVRCVRATASPNGTQALWVGTAGGLARFSGNDLRTYDTRSGLPGNVVYTLLDTRTPNGTSALLVGTLGGLAWWTTGTWSTIDTTAGLPDNVVYSLLVTQSAPGDETLWVGTNGGLARLERGRWTAFNRATGLPGNRVTCLLDTRSAGGGRAIWVGTANGLARFENGRWTTYDQSNGLPDSGVRCLLETSAPDGSRVLWVGTYGGLGRFEHGNWTIYKKDDGLPHDGVLGLTETEGADGAKTLWVGTYGGLARFDGQTWQTVDVDLGLPRGGVRCLHVSHAGGRRTLWAGTAGAGASRLDLDDPAGRWISIDDATTPGLPNNVVYQIREDASGRLYLMTNRGVARLSHRTPTEEDPAVFSVTVYTTDDGLPNNECNSGASTVDPLGRIWIGTVAGAAVFDPASDVVDSTSDPIVIRRAWLPATGAPLDSGATLAYDENNCAFEFALLDFLREKHIQYRTQLVGLDDRPSDWAADFKKEYTNLSSGRYAFTVWGRDDAGNVSGPLTYEFTVRAAPWRTWWAYLLYALGLVLLVYAGIHVRYRALRRSNEYLEDKVRERTAEIAEKVAALEVSEHRALEAKRKAVEANRAKGVFLAKMSHELRTPLNAILGFVQLMERDRRRVPEDRENLAVITRSGENLLALILDLLAVSKIEAGGARVAEHAFDLHRLLRGLEEMFGVEAHAKGLHFGFELPPDLPRYVWGDENKLRQILIKVLGNAVKYTLRGSVTLRMRWREGRATFEVRDTGNGIPPENIERIFGAFVQGSAEPQFQEGAGLGLTIARAFARLMNGDLTIASARGEGTTVRVEVRLPLASGIEATADTRRVIGLERGQPSFRILVADDTWENRTLLARLLSSAGFDVREVRNGDEAVSAWASWHPHLIFMDTRMAGMDGFAATREIRRQEGARSQGPGAGEATPAGTWPLIPDHSIIVATTTSEYDQEREDIFEAGCDDFMVKPSTETTIFDKVAALLGVRYDYAEALPVEDPYPAEAPVTADHFASLPPDIVEQLHRAVLEGDVESAMVATARVRDYDERLANALRSMIRTYRFDDIQDLIEAIKS